MAKYNIVWANSAEDDFIELLQFLDDNYGVTSAMKLLNKVEKNPNRT